MKKDNNINMIKQQQLPEWFEGTLYDEGEEVINPFSGAAYDLDRYELSIYDYIIGATMALEMGMYDDETHDEIAVDVHRAKRWFAKKNPKAYMVLLD